MRRSIRAASVAVAMFVSVVSASLAGAAPEQPSTYCPERDAYEITDCADEPRVPAGPLGEQLQWMLDQLAGDAATVTAAEVREHFTERFLTFPGQTPRVIRSALRETLEHFGPMVFEGFAYPPRSTQALALLRADSGTRAEVPISIAARSGLINSIAVSEAMPVIVPTGSYSGWFDIGGRRLFMRCTGSGSPTVVFENGLTTDWYSLQDQLSESTTVCSYDPARQGGPSSRSDGAPAPRTGLDRVHDLNALLTTSGVPGPYVLAAHSNGGLFSLLYSSLYPDDVAGLVLIDGVHPRYHRRMFNALKHLIPRDQRRAAWEQLCSVPSRQIDWERMDICLSEAQARSQLRDAPLETMPLVVISHGVPEGAPGEERRISERVWQELQAELAAMMPGSDHVIARRSGHDIQHTQPGLVLREIRRVMDAVRAGRETLNP
jgi:pimeloyl-ACP methyl ester carboxylesterase